uniref:Uncharacterized protein n=1 Tax=Candidatus Kentrum sp. LPFa TaxID=2126335 RepID=A0A450XED0_9GAMM|nr:MAG: hypothetical protein BECKLPF1236A_GA0070988_105942 [Candidatus Kentron sp. LPFa]
MNGPVIFAGMRIAHVLAVHRQRPADRKPARHWVNIRRLLHEVQNLVAQGGATKIKCNKHLILKDRENHIFLDPLLCRARDGSCKALGSVY